MSSHQIVRAWKDPGWRNALSTAERAALPANPAGSIEISDEDLGRIAGGRQNSWWCHTCSACTCFEVCSTPVTMMCLQP